MAGMGAYLTQKVLNVTLQQAASLASPATLGVGLCVGAPTSLSASEVGTASGYTPQSLTMGSVAASGTVASNVNSLSYGPFSSTQAISGVVVKDTLSASVSAGNLGDIFYFGNLATARTVSPGDSLIIAAAALTISLS
jgi:hypothetical protein